jgi:hypothetical protein
MCFSSLPPLEKGASGFLVGAGTIYKRLKLDWAASPNSEKGK